MFEVIKPGLETSVQELPGRIGYWEQGFPPSGPADMWSFRLANLLVGNDRDTAALECQLIGPTLHLARDGVIALAGGDMPAKLDDAPVPYWKTVPVRSGQVLALGSPRNPDCEPTSPSTAASTRRWCLARARPFIWPVSAAWAALPSRPARPLR